MSDLRANPSAAAGSSPSAAASPVHMFPSLRGSDLPSRRTPVRVLLVKPYQDVPARVAQPPLGLLYLASSLRHRFGDAVDVRVVDLKSRAQPVEALEPLLRDAPPDFVGVSALNCEASASADISRFVHRHLPKSITVLGGPYAHSRAEEMLERTEFDWVFDGGAERTFPEAIHRHVAGLPLGSDIPGFSWRGRDGRHIGLGTDAVRDLDDLPFPAWDLVDFDEYAPQRNMMSALRGRRYAPIFTSRGCPFRCNYCHDIFGKRFIHRSPENVLAEIELLYERYGVDEFEVVDDIFNLDKPRVKAILGEVARRWPGRLHFCFPNGLRADVLNEEILDVMRDAGVYAMAIAIETVTPRLQKLVDKNLRIDKAARMIDAADDRGMMVCGSFMMGFPTETPEEIEATVDFALRSRLTTANFFSVLPQPGTPLYDLAKREHPQALEQVHADEIEGTSYQSALAWYERAYGFPLGDYRRDVYRRFYLAPRRIWRILRRVPPRSLLSGFRGAMTNIVRPIGSTRVFLARAETAPVRRAGADRALPGGGGIV